MVEDQIESLPGSIKPLKEIKAVLEKINNLNNITILRYKTSIEKMITACQFVIDNVRILERAIRTS